ncbi:hypothetical protein ABT095_02245 [Kitasatospora sp. NPDC002227]|uniref:hypothetical protein n=1 Tax=Kitasatospora sp. NPDC002227 TaxID=3154773 RepID=UPI003329D831
METTKKITKLTGQTVFVMPSCASAQFGTAGFAASASVLSRGAVQLAGNGLGLDATGVSIVVSGLGHTGATFAETGLSIDWAEFGGSRELRSERGIPAPKAVVAAAKHGVYAQVIGADNTQQQDEQQQINPASAAPMGAMAVRMRAFRGPQPWRERT